MGIDNKAPLTNNELQGFLKQVDFTLPKGFIDFFKEANGADACTDESYLLLWPLTDLVRLNKEYNVDMYAPGFFLFGSNGGGIAYAIDRRTGYIYEMPFIGMSETESIFICKTFTELLRLF